MTKQRHDDEERRGVTRRGFLGRSAAVGGALGVPLGAREADAALTSEPPETNRIPVQITINGTDHRLRVDPRLTLLDLLREHLGLTGTKVGCNHGQCGACTVLLDGTRINACFQLAAAASGHEVTTIEGIAEGQELHPMQAAFIEHDGFQCGYCTPGQIVSAIGCVKEGHADSPAEIREYMSGNLCRCGAYDGIVEAVKTARDETREKKAGSR